MYIPSRHERRRRALALIDRVGMTPFRHHRGSKLSGGQKQRTVIARALAKDSPIILADEPTAALDTPRVKEVGNLLSNLAHRQNKAVITVTHDLRLLDQADRVYDLNDGKLNER